MAPFQGAGNRSLRSGGLRQASTTGYYLPAFQAEDVLATFPHSLYRVAILTSWDPHSDC
ncbi:MAG: hypothetical protein AABN95_19245 [Acidobacteriota bacterium]